MASQTKKEAIVKVASKMFSEQGFAETSIAAIARAAGVRETLIYELFAGKEDLLFNIPVKKTAILIESLIEHLRGVKGAENKLRKVIWHYLNFQETNRDYAALIFFQLRPNRRFYNSESYNSFKSYNKIVMDILREGMEEGVFNEQISLHLFRNLIFGALDHVIYSWILFNKVRTPTAQADELCEIMLAAARPEPSSDEAGEGSSDEREWTLDKKNMILRAAESIFAKKGFDKTRISDIAKAISMGEATLYEYFKNKEDILFNIPVDRTSNLLNSVTEGLNKDRRAEIELSNFVWHYLYFLQTHKNYTAVILFELRPNRRFYDSVAYQTTRDFNDVMINILKKGQENNNFRKDVNIYLARHMIFGSIDHTALTWLLFGKPVNLLSQAEDLTSLFLRVLKA